MKKIYLLLSLVWIAHNASAQNTFPSTGSAGIGTSTPQTALQIGSTTGSNFITLAGGVTGSSYGINYAFNTPGTNIYAQNLFEYDNRATRGLQFNTQAVYAFSFNTISNTGVFANNLLTILGSGRVGIGTATPGSLTHLYKAGGSAVLNIENTGSGNSSGISFIRERATGPGILGATIFVNSNTADNNAFLYLQAQTAIPSNQTSPLVAANGARMILRGGTGAISFENGAAETVRFDANGNVGIATTDTKGYKLAVNGSAIATAMWVKNFTDWPDYVFKTGYRLPALNEVKTYIDANHHLPDVPTEQDVKQNGLNLGEMNRVLVKKVEELTLYMIEQDKATQEQKEISKKQQQQIDDLKQQLQLLLKKSDKN
jgi:hypothetical protein